MGKRESYEPGTFSWVELAAEDAAAAQEFYSTIFEWNFDDLPLDDGGVYSMATLEGARVAAVFAADPPARWNCYVTVKDVAESTKKADELGATIVAEPFDVMDAGKMSVIQDPSGGVVSLWEPKATIGAELVNHPGTLAWNDLMTYDVDAAAEFYCELFGWEVAELDMPEGAGKRLAIKNGETMNGGIATIPESAGEKVPPHWLAYFAVESAERTAKAAEDAGGTLMAGPIEVPSGKFALLADPGGAVFGVVDGEMDE